MNANDPIFEALDRLARVADANPHGDPMPGITRKVRANRRRANALVAGGLAVVVGAGVGVSSVVDLPDVTRNAGYADTPTTSPTSDLSTPTSDPSTPMRSPTPDPSPSESSLSDPALAEFDRASADVDGDGTADTIRVRVPEADAAREKHVIMFSDDVRLQVELAAGGMVELRLGETLAPTISGTSDLDDDGTVEVALTFTGGDAGWLRVFTWEDGTMVQAEPATDSPAELVDDGGLHAAPDVASFALVDDGLISWASADPSTLDKVRVWFWQLDGLRLVATEAEELQCMGSGRYPTSC